MVDSLDCVRLNATAMVHIHCEIVVYITVYSGNWSGMRVPGIHILVRLAV